MTTLVTRLTDLATRVATEDKSLRTLLNGNAAGLTALNTTAKTNLVAALNELKSGLDAAVAASGATINDSVTTSTTQTYSVTKINAAITAAITAVTNGAPAALDTLKELSDAIGSDANFASTITAALGNRVRVDAAQSLTTGQQAQARANIGADITTADIGTPDTNFVTVFNTGLI